MANSPLRRTVGVLSSLLLAALFVTGFAGTAHAEGGYRYWNYFHLTGQTWEFSQVGPSGYQPKDGAVEAYRFGTSASSDADGIPPRTDLSEVNFDTVCADKQAATGKKRVAVVLDYGSEADADGATPPAPVGECAVVDAKANGQQVLDNVADVRSEDGLTCALDGYPVKGCGDPVTDVKATDERPVTFELPISEAASDDASSDSTEEDSDLLWPLIGVGLAVVLVAASALAMNRRKRSV